jgi:hypothetical protein
MLFHHEGIAEMRGAVMPSCGRGDAVNLRELSFTLVVSIPPAKSIELGKLSVSALRIVE